ncbi:MAG: hypothetical protein ABL909_06930, partial [Sphingopyxis sp.]
MASSPSVSRAGVSGDTLFLSSRGSGGAGANSDPQSSISPGNGGLGSGGVITALIGGPLDGTAQVSIRGGLTADTGAVGGAGGNKLLFGPGALYSTPGYGGTARAGNIFFTHSGSQFSDGSDGPANINLSARALGGNGGILVLDGATP